MKSSKRRMICPYLTGAENVCHKEECPFYMSDEAIEEFKRLTLEHGKFYMIPSNCSNTFEIFDAHKNEVTKND